MLTFVVPVIQVLKNHDKVMIMNRDNIKRHVISAEQYQALLSAVGSDELKPGKYTIEDNTPAAEAAFGCLIKNVFHTEGYKPVVKPLSSYMNNGHSLKMVYLFMTSRCNMRCIYCYRDAKHVVAGTRSAGVDVPKVKRLIDILADMNIAELAFTGGEPMLVKEIFELGAYAREKGIYTCLLTNGTLITPENVSRLSCFNVVKISLDSAVASVNEITRGKGTTELIKRGIRLVKGQGIKVVIECVVNRSNYETLEQTIRELYMDLGVDEIRFTYMEPIGRGKDNSLLMDGPYDVSQRKIIKAQWDVIGEKYSKTTQGNLISNSKCMTGCGAGISEIMVECDGSTYPCRLFQQPEYYMGNLLEESLSEMQQKSSFQALREKLAVDSVKECMDCSYKYLCGGGCRPAHKGFTGDYQVNARQWCDMTRVNTEFLLWLQERIDPFSGKPFAQCAGDEAAPQ